MDVSTWIDQPFRVLAEEDDSEVFFGTIHFRADDTEYDGAPLTGETVLELNFSAVSQPGQYHLHVDGIGRSWSFEVGQNALGQTFFTHARGLFHQRCGMELLPGTQRYLHSFVLWVSELMAQLDFCCWMVAHTDFHDHCVARSKHWILDLDLNHVT